MKTKTLLIAAAALAAGIISSQAQSVYSQNVVGYANIATPSSGVQYLISIPFKIGVSNGANEVFPTLPEFSTLLLWDVPTQNYKTVQTDTSSASGWSDGDFNPVPPPLLPVGKGFFMSPSAPITNVFAGTVAVDVGTSNKMVLPNAGVQYLVSCVVPYAGAVTNGNSSTGGPNLNGLPEFSTLLLWDVPTQNYKTVQTDTSSASGWSDGDFNPVPVPTINVGQGFFLSPSSPYTWTTGL